MANFLSFSEKLLLSPMSQRKILYIFLLLNLVIVHNGCTGSKSYYKKAEKFKAAGMEDEAAEFYYESVRRNPSNVDARIALKTMGQKILDKKYEKFYIAHGSGQYGEAVYAYREAINYKQKVGAFVALEQPPYYESSYNESKDRYLSERYKEANQLMLEEKFDLADKILKEILSIEPNYAEAGKLQRTSSAEPLYRAATESFESGNFRSAYYGFKSVTDIDPNYKDARLRQTESLSKARLTVAVLPVEAGSSADKAAADKLYDVVIAELLKTGNPFITVIDRRYTQQILEEQRMGLSGMIEHSSAAQAGKMLGAKIVLSAKLISLSEQVQNPSKQVQRGWEEYTERRYNKETGNYYNQTMYRKVQYEIFSGKSEVSLSASATLISSETGEVMSGNSFTRNAADILQYALYEGNRTALMPGYWASLVINKPEDKIITSGPEKKALEQMLNERRRALNSIATLRLSAMQEVGLDISKALVQYEQNRR